MKVTKGNITWQYDVEYMHVLLSNDGGERKIVIHSSCCVWEGAEMIATKTLGTPLEIDLTVEKVDPQVVQAMALLEEATEKVLQARAVKKHGISPAPTSSSAPSPIPVPTPTPPNRPNNKDS